jgi:hypothetical protein
MPHKDLGKRKLLAKTMPMLGAAGLSLAIGTSAAIGSINPDPITSARVAEPMMDEEQISDISLATFHLFNGDRGSPPRRRPATISQGACGADLYLLGVFSEFERAMVVDRVRSGLAKAKARGKRSGKAIGRPRSSSSRRFPPWRSATVPQQSPALSSGRRSNIEALAYSASQCGLTDAR